MGPDHHRLGWIVLGLQQLAAESNLVDLTGISVFEGGFVLVNDEVRNPVVFVFRGRNADLPVYFSGSERAGDARKRYFAPSRSF